MARRRPPGDDEARELFRVRFEGGPLSGATLDLPAELADAPPGRLIVTDGGTVFDRYRSRPVPEARVIEPPSRDRAPSSRGHARPTVSWRSPFL